MGRSPVIPVVRWMLRRMFVIYIALNMLVCSIAFAPWALPRETVSGLLGRWQSERGAKRVVSLIGSAIADAIYFWEPDHCRETYLIEQRAREVLYP